MLSEVLTTEKELPLVLLADELDYLFTKNQQVIYKLFDWPNEPNSHLIVIVRLASLGHPQGISNTIDLPERILSLRSISRLSMNRVLFKPYSREQIATIINVISPPPPHAQQRLDALAVFSPEAIDLCSRKVSAVSGDIRRALTIAKRGVELAAERGADTWVWLSV